MRGWRRTPVCVLCWNTDPGIGPFCSAIRMMTASFSRQITAPRPSARPSWTMRRQRMIELMVGLFVLVAVLLVAWLLGRLMAGADEKRTVVLFLSGGLALLFSGLVLALAYIIGL